MFINYASLWFIMIINNQLLYIVTCDCHVYVICHVLQYRVHVTMSSWAINTLRRIAGAIMALRHGVAVLSILEAASRSKLAVAIPCCRKSVRHVLVRLHLPLYYTYYITYAASCTYERILYIIHTLGSWQIQLL